MQELCEKTKSSKEKEKKPHPDILASVTINLLLTAFNVISSHMFQMCLCLPSFSFFYPPNYSLHKLTPIKAA